METDPKKPVSGKRTSVGRPIKKTAPPPLPAEASARVSAAAAAAAAVKPTAAPPPPAKAPSAVTARPVPPAPVIVLPTVVPVATRKVEMSFDAPLAEHVNIAGDFNAWEMTTLALRKADGLWRITLDLKPGAYQYKFLVDGEWVNDPNNVRTTPNQFGSLNNMLEVS